MLKDMRPVTDAAARAERDLRVASGAREWFEMAAGAGAGELDCSAVVATIVAQGPAR